MGVGPRRQAPARSGGRRHPGVGLAGLGLVGRLIRPNPTGRALIAVAVEDPPLGARPRSRSRGRRGAFALNLPDACVSGRQLGVNTRQFLLCCQSARLSPVCGPAGIGGRARRLCGRTLGVARDLDGCRCGLRRNSSSRSAAAARRSSSSSTLAAASSRRGSGGATGRRICSASGSARRATTSKRRTGPG